MRRTPGMLHVLYDGECGLCGRFKAWLERQPVHLPVLFIPLQDPSVPKRFPGVERYDPEKEIVVIDDHGDVYQGAHAWVLCLWATIEYRVLSHKLATPTLMPMVRALCATVSSNRLRLSSLLGLKADDLARQMVVLEDPYCEDGACATPAWEGA